MLLRARDGCTRIAALLDAMRSASRLEQAIQHVERKLFFSVDFAFRAGGKLPANTAGQKHP